MMRRRKQDSCVVLLRMVKEVKGWTKIKAGRGDGRVFCSSQTTNDNFKLYCNSACTDLKSVV